MGWYNAVMLGEAEETGLTVCGVQGSGKVGDPFLNGLPIEPDISSTHLFSSESHDLGPPRIDAHLRSTTWVQSQAPLRARLPLW